MTNDTADLSSPDASQDASRSTAVAKLADLMHGVTFAMVTTLDADGEFVSRPMSHQDVEFDGDLWFISSRDSRKVTHISANPNVSVTLTSTSTFVSLNGTAEVVDDPAKAEQLWSAEMEAWFPQGPHDDSIVCIKVSGQTAEYWDTPGGRVATAVSLAKAKLTGKRYTAGDNDIVNIAETNA